MKPGALANAASLHMIAIIINLNVVSIIIIIIIIFIIIIVVKINIEVIICLELPTSRNHLFLLVNEAGGDLMATVLELCLWTIMSTFDTEGN